MDKHFCRQCGTEIVQDAVFCPNCGAKQHNEQPQQSTPVQQPQQAYMPQPTQSVYQQSPYAPAPKSSKGKRLGVIIGAIALVIVLAVVFLVFIMPKIGGKTGQGDYHVIPASVLKNVNVDAIDGEYAGAYTGTVTITTNAETWDGFTSAFDYAEYIKYGKSFSCNATFDGYKGVCLEAVNNEEIYSFYSDLVDGVVVDQFVVPKEKYTFKRNEAAYFLKDGSIYVIATEEYEKATGEYYAIEMRIDLKPVS